MHRTLQEGTLVSVLMLFWLHVDGQGQKGTVELRVRGWAYPGQHSGGGWEDPDYKTAFFRVLVLMGNLGVSSSHTDFSSSLCLGVFD